MSKLKIKSKRLMVALLVAATAVLLAAVFIFADQMQTRDSDVLLVIGGENGDEIEDGGTYAVHHAQSAASMVIHISGEVYNPGVFTFYVGARVWDAVQAAGGLTADADLNAINLARLLQDEDHIVVFSIEENMPTTATIGGRETDTGDLRININTATSEQLQALSGIGPATAGNIIRHREARGGFETIEEIMNVSGIGERMFENIRDSIRVD